jgi:hypothetical protein
VGRERLTEELHACAQNEDMRGGRRRVEGSSVLLLLLLLLLLILTATAWGG